MPFPGFWQNPYELRHVPSLGYPDTLKCPGKHGQKTEISYCYEIVMSAWLPFLNAYRTMCGAPEPEFRQLLQDIRTLDLAA